MRGDRLFWIKNTLGVDKYCYVNDLSQVQLSKIEESQEYIVEVEDDEYQLNMRQLSWEHEEGLLSID